MRNYLMVQRVKRWALQDSNLRPSDYESASGSISRNELQRPPSQFIGRLRQALAASRTKSATPSATHFQIPDPYADSKILLLGMWVF